MSRDDPRPEDPVDAGPGADDRPNDIGEAATLLVSEEPEFPAMRAPPPGGLGHAAERERFLAAMFGAPAEPRTLGRYVVLGTLGQGGMGTVLEAFDRTLDRPIALKVLHEQLDPRHSARLLREAQALAKLSHPHVVQVYEAGRADGQNFIAMELVRGRSLRAWIEQDPRPGWRECVEVYLQAGEGLAAAHARGLVHRDFKPSNTVIDEQGRVRVLDFGLVREATEHDVDVDTHDDRVPDDRVPDDDALDTPLTRTGTVLGTPAYMPPEQMKGRPADARSDQFSFCVSLYEALHGERPFEGTSMVALLLSMTHGDLRPPPRGSTVPPRLRAVLRRGLAPDPAQRWPSMDALLGQLRDLVAPRTRRWLGVGVGVTVGLGLVGASLVYQARVAQRCAGARAQLSGIWDPARRRQVESAILGTARSYAPGTWARVERRLDDYADAWVDAHTEVCEATALREEQSEADRSLRMQCLYDRKNELDATVEQLAQADAQTVDNAVKLAAGLPGLAPCDDLARLQQRAQALAPPEDEQVAQQVEALRDRLKRALVLERDGRYARALTDEAAPVVERAEALGYAPLLAEAKRMRGSLRQHLGEYEAAQQDLREAYWLALRHDHEQVEHDAAKGLTALLGNRLRRPDEGWQWGQTALALAARTGEAADEAYDLNNLASVLFRQGEYDAMEDALREALAILETERGSDHPDVAQTMNNLTILLKHRGRYAEAEATSRRALGIWEAALGEGHPLVAANMVNLGNVLEQQGKYEEAEATHRRALAARQAALGASHPDVAASLNGLGHVLERRGKYEEAEAIHRQALQMRETLLGPDHPDVAASLDTLGQVLGRRGELAEAEATLRRALRMRETAPKPNPADVATSLANLGSVLSSRGELGEAEQVYRRALPLGETAWGAGHSYVADITYNLGNTLLGQGKLEEAESTIRRALQLGEAALGADHPRLAYSHGSLARVALARHDHPSAREHAERATSLCDAATVAPDMCAEAWFALARALWSDPAARSRARALTQRARDTWAAHGKGREEDLAEAEAWLAEHRVP